jgi:hypothetical protein
MRWHARAAARVRARAIFARDRATHSRVAALLFFLPHALMHWHHRLTARSQQADGGVAACDVNTIGGAGGWVTFGPPRSESLGADCVITAASCG